MTPLQIRMAIAYHASTIPRQLFTQDTWRSPAGRDARLWLLNEGLINADGTPTGKLAAYVEHLCAVPLPVAVWVSAGETDQ